MTSDHVPPAAPTRAAPHTSRPHRRRVAVGLAAVAVAALGASHTALAGADGPDVPTRLAVQGPFKPFLDVHADGVQIYRCGVTAGAYQWSLVAPRATLTNDAGKLVGTHSGGPTWTARDGSSVVGRRIDGVTVDPTAIPWLLLQAASTSPGADGDRLAGTAWIQRINTVGGLAPAATTCTTEHAGETVEVPYTADYVFWKATGG